MRGQAKLLANIRKLVQSPKALVTYRGPLVS